MTNKEIEARVRYIDEVWLNVSLTREQVEFAEQIKLTNPPEIMNYTRALRRTSDKANDK